MQASKADVEALSRMRIVFAHQSVGFNVIDGIRQIASREGLQINIQETRRPAAEGPGLFHFKVGRNEFPDEKISDFSRMLAADAGLQLDAAVFKLCYIDFNAPIDAPGLARRYIDAMNAAQQARPDVRIIAVTAPLTVTQTGPKAWVKRLLGRTPSGVDENGRRHAFNEVLRSTMPRDRLFDLAAAESLPGVESLDPGLTSDGGHLNDRGQAAVAGAFVHFLAHAPGTTP